MNINQLVLEGSKPKDPWNTDQLIRRIRRDKISNTKKKMNVDFDLENDDADGDKREIRIQIDTFPDGSPQLNVFKCQLFKACGDWEYPVAYFFCQIIKGRLHQFGEKKSSVGIYNGESSFFCFIPMIDNCLVKSGDKYYTYTDEKYKKEEIPKFKDSSYWKQLNEYLETISKVKYSERSLNYKYEYKPTYT